MKRYALIIANPGEENSENYCAGVLKDITSYKNFLTSSIGGFWSSSEIKTLIKPTVMQVKTAILEAKSFDYSFIVFAGHGYYSTSKKTTILNLGNGIEIDSNELRIGAKKQSVILDCCRKKILTSIIEKRAVLSFAEDSAMKINPSECRKYYDQSITNCADGLIVIHSCSIDETASDDSEKGGLYSYNLLDEAISWAKNRVKEVDISSKYSSSSISESHDSATNIVKKLSGNRQNPEIEKPRSAPYFPFVIVA